MLPPPKTLEVLALSTTNDTALAGARVAVSMARRTYFPRHFASGKDLDALGAQWHELGTTDASGKLEVVLPDPSDATIHAWLAVRKGAFAVGFGGWSKRSPGTHAVANDGEQVRIWLKPSQTLRGRVFLSRGVPAANLALLCEGPVRHRVKSKKYSTRHSYDARIVNCDGEGRLVLPLSGRQRLIACLGKGTSQHDKVLLWARGERGSEARIGDIVIDEIPELELSIRAPDGRPQVADVYVDSYFKDERTPPARFLALRSGHRGRARLRIPKGRYQVAVVARGVGYHISEVEVGAKGEQLAIELQAMKLVRGRVVDQRDLPIPNARVEVQFSNTTGAARMTKFVERLGWELLRATTDVDGAFECRFVPSPKVSWGLRVTRVDARKILDGPHVRVRSETMLDAKLIY